MIRSVCECVSVRVEREYLACALFKVCKYHHLTALFKYLESKLACCFHLSHAINSQRLSMRSSLPWLWRRVVSVHPSSLAPAGDGHVILAVQVMGILAVQVMIILAVQVMVLMAVQVMIILAVQLMIKLT